jgi:hypothetical protein
VNIADLKTRVCAGFIRTSSKDYDESSIHRFFLRLYNSVRAPSTDRFQRF